MDTTTAFDNATHPAGSDHIITLDDKLTAVQVCGIDARRGYRVSNRQWGGQVDTWVPFTALAAVDTEGK